MRIARLVALEFLVFDSFDTRGQVVSRRAACRETRHRFVMLVAFLAFLSVKSPRFSHRMLLKSKLPLLTLALSTFYCLSVSESWCCARYQSHDPSQFVTRVHHFWYSEQNLL